MSGVGLLFEARVLDFLGPEELSCQNLYFESRRMGLRFFWVYIILAFAVAFAFAFPLFLFIRQGKLEKA